MKPVWGLLQNNTLGPERRGGHREDQSDRDLTLVKSRGGAVTAPLALVSTFVFV